jgi:transposase InsO family protein
MGVSRTYERIREKFYWRNMLSDIQQFVQSCVVCGMTKQADGRPAGLLQPIPVWAPSHLVGIDILGPMPMDKHGYRYILVISDHFTKWSTACPMRTMEAMEVASLFVERWICERGIPDRLLSDCGSQFTSNLMKSVCKILGIHKVYTTPYHPQTDGTVERYNRSLLSMLKKFIHDRQSEWPMFISLVCFAYNTSVHASTGYTPYFLEHGREASLPSDAAVVLQRRLSDVVISGATAANYRSQLLDALVDARTLAAENIETAQARMKRNYDARKSDTEFQVDDLVWVYQPVPPDGQSPKLYAAWSGPWRVVTKLSPLLYRVIDKFGKKASMIVNVSRMKRFTNQIDKPVRAPIDSGVVPRGRANFY